MKVKSKNLLLIGIIAIIGTAIMIIAVSYLPIPGIPSSKQMNNTIKEPQQPAFSKEDLKFITEIDSEQSLNAALDSQKPLIIKVYHDFCPPCRRAKAVWPIIAKQFDGKVTFYSLNVAQQELTKMAEAKGLFSLSKLATPTFILRNNGKNINKIEGFGDADTLYKQIHSGFSL